MLKHLTLLSLILSNTAYCDFFCPTDGSQRRGDTYLACGQGNATTELVARNRAFYDAMREFVITCELSDDCRGHKTSVTPKRTECSTTAGGITCMRLIEVAVGPLRVATRDHVTAQSVEMTQAQSCAQYIIVYPIALAVRAIGNYPKHECFPW